MTVYLFDNSKNLIGDIDPALVQNYTQKSTLNGRITATVTAVYSDDIESAHYFGSHDVDDSSVFWMYRITSVKKYDRLIALQGIHLLFDELQAGVIRDIMPRGVDAGDPLGRILDGTNWQIGTDESSGVASKNYYHVSRLSAFWDFLTTWRVEFRPRLTFLNGEIVGRHIDIYDQMSDDFGKWYEYGDQLITVAAEQANENIYTAVVGMGKGEPSGDGFGRKIKFTDVVWSTTQAIRSTNQPVRIMSNCRMLWRFTVCLKQLLTSLKLRIPKFCCKRHMISWPRCPDHAWNSTLTPSNRAWSIWAKRSRLFATT